MITNQANQNNTKLGIHHLKVNMSAKDFDQSKRFYTALGFKISEGWGGSVDFELLTFQPLEGLEWKDKEFAMQIKQLAALAKVSPKTIRYYESIGVLPEPERSPNGYREYEDSDVERLKLVLGARRLEFSLDDVTEIIAMRDRREAPCRTVLDKLSQKADEIAQRITELQRLEHELRHLYDLGQTFPTDDVDGKACVCHLVSEQSTVSDTR